MKKELDFRKELEHIQPKDESKEVKEGGELFTGGQWVKSHKQANSYSIHAGLIELAAVTGEMGSDAIANACLFEQSKNMYYKLKEILQWVKVKDGRAEWKTSAEKINELKQLLDKATPKK